MSESIRLKEPYLLARCCTPGTDQPITGYYSYDNTIKVHRTGCPNLNTTDQERLIALVWEDILAGEVFSPGDDYATLDDTDFAILKLHRDYGIDYSLKVARMLNLDKEDTFARHRKLRDLGLLERVEPLIVRYRKGIVDNKWIKHRNHTYYDLTDRGSAYLDHFLKS
ncbi:MAG: DUF2250 domain-containing protein [candidate division Zixibacteria bacterium]|nr:DUF2250 domain-containing protein [candidate division Zixibacteria bacterium]